MNEQTQTIIESEMTFGPFAVEDIFHVEKSALYNKLQNSFKIAEFVLLRKIIKTRRPVWIVEAKKTPPNPAISENEESLGDICTKFSNTLALTIALWLKRHEMQDSEFPIKFRGLDLSSTDFRFVFVVKDSKPEWHPPLKDDLCKRLTPVIKAWNISNPAIVVLNEEEAREKRLIS